jgi:flagellar assembly protein FliH
MAPQRKLITAAELSRFEPWELPVVGAEEPRPGDAEDELARPLTAAQLEALHAQAYQEGFAEGRRAGEEAGYRQGRASGEAEAAVLVGRLQAILDLLAAPLEDLDREVEESLVALATSIARHLLRRELRADPGQVIAVVREAVSVLPVAARNVRLHLNPADAALVRERMRVGEGEESRWQIVEDPVITRGGCRVSTDVSVVDASVEQRFAAVVARVLGEEREGERAA